MKLANLDGRAALIAADGSAVDVHKISDGAFGPDLQPIYEDWAAFRAWATQQDLSDADGTTFDATALGAPSPRPRQILAVGLNYADHAAESGFDSPTGLPPVFPKFVSSLSGPDTTVSLPPGGNTDWEVELVVVLGKQATAISANEAWDHVAGITAGNDISERVIQLSGPAPQFGLGKSYPGFTPTGPWLITTDEVDNPDDLALRCSLNGEIVQDGRTANLIVGVPELLSQISKVVTLYPGDLLFTGTPKGVGLGRTPQRFIQPGEELVTTIEGIGELRQRFVAADGAES